MGTSGNRPFGVGLSPSATTLPPDSTSIRLLGYLGIRLILLRGLPNPPSTTSAESPPAVALVTSIVWSVRNIVLVLALASPWVTSPPTGPDVTDIGPSGSLKPKPSGE